MNTATIKTTAGPRTIEPKAGPRVDRLLEDEKARRRALDLTSFIVEAPAGAGKTELLTQRTLRLLATVDHPEEVLALTFTNKAAAEMRDRILGSLEVACQPVDELPPHKQETQKWALAVLARDKEKNWGLLEHPGRLRVTTLDALCAGLARQMPFLSRFGAQPAVSDDAEAHYTTAARHTLEMVELETPDGEVVAAALAFMDNDAGRLERLIIIMLGRRDQWLQHAVRLGSSALRSEVEAGFAGLVEHDLAKVAELLDARWQKRLMPLAHFAAVNVPESLNLLAKWDKPLGTQASDMPAWRQLASLLLTNEGSLRKALNKNIGFPAGKEFAEQKKAMSELIAELASVPDMEAVLGELPGLPSPILSDAEWSTVENFSHLLRLAAGQLWLAFQQAAEVDFIEIASRAGLALGDDEAPTDLAQALDYRISHLLVDEFQDTSPSQVALLEKLMRGWMPDDGRTLFVVGDPMQSIYRFRKADVGLFLNVREHGMGDLQLEHLRLYRNNRSHPGIVDWVNLAFPTIFPAQDEPAAGAVCYAESAATKPAVADSGVIVHPVIVRDGVDPVSEEARLALALIQDARENDPQGRIAVLVRARKHLDALVDEIRRTAPNLPFQAVEIEGLAERQHVQDLLTLFRALTHRADRVHWLALLRAPWCGLVLADLYALAAGDKRRTIWQLMHDDSRLGAMSDDGRARLLHVRGILELAFAERDRQPPRRWLEGVWLMLGGPQCLASPSALADVETFFGLVDALTASRKLDPDNLTAQAAELYAPADPEGGAVQMMTIHKAKGLEFETVIVPGLQRDTGGNDSALLLWDEVMGNDGVQRLLVAPMRAKGEQASEPSVFDYLRRLENARASHETERLLYVAATRAIRRLHLIGLAEPSDKSDDGLKPPASGSLLKLLWPNVAQPVFATALAEGENTVVPVDAFDPASFVPPLIRLAKPLIPAALALAPEATPFKPNASQALSDDMPAEIELLLETSVGTLVHRCLELIVRQGLAHWPETRLHDLAPAWQRWLIQQGHQPAAAEKGAQEALTAVRNTLTSETGCWLLSAHEAGAAEQAWSTSEGDIAVNHVIDRVFIDQGYRWIIDYKTVRNIADPELELAKRAEAFRPQLERYARLFANDPLPLRLAVWFPLQSKLLELFE